MSHAGMDGEIAARQVSSLQDTIEAYNKTASKQAAEMLSLTKQIKWLTILLAVITVVQFLLMFKKG